MNPKTIDTLITKIGLNPVQAVWVMGLSEKHAIWIGNQIKTNQEIFPKEGGNIKKILTWIKKNPAIDLGLMEYKDALSASLESEKTSFKRDRGSLKNEKIVAACEGTQYKWVELKTEEDCVEEGRAMKHCLRNSGTAYLRTGMRLFSLRTEYNKPVLTMHLVKGDIREYRAKFNNRPDAQFDKLVAFLEKNGDVKITEQSKIKWGIEKLKVDAKIWDGDLHIEQELDLPKGLRVKGDLIISTGEDVLLPKGLVVDGDLVLEDYGYDIGYDSNIVVKGDIKIHGAGSYNFSINMKKVKLGGEVVFCS